MKNKYKKIRENSKELIRYRKASIPSNGEQRIINFLQSEAIEFSREHFFKDLFNRQTRQLLYFDFYIKQFNLCIEFDGEQHFRTKKSQNEQTNDFLKNAYCRKNGIHLLRIRHTDLEKY